MALPTLSNTVVEFQIKNILSCLRSIFSIHAETGNISNAVPVPAGYLPSQVELAVDPVKPGTCIAFENQPCTTGT